MGKLKYPVIDGKKRCAKCKEMLDISNYDRARNHYASMCKKCKAEWAKEYRQRPEVKRAMAVYVIEYRKNPVNREKINKKIREWRKLPQSRFKINKARREWTAKEKQKAVDYKGGKCVVCDYNKCLAALDFHHSDPLKKEGYGTGALVAHWSFERNKKELDKCVLVCVRCHREIHAGEVVL